MANSNHSRQSLFQQSIYRFLEKSAHGLPVNEIISLLRDELVATIGFRHAWLYGLSIDGKRLDILADALSGNNRPVAGYHLLISGDRYLEELRQAQDLFVVDDALTDDRINPEIVRILENRTIIHMPVEIRGRFCLIGTGTFGREGVVRLKAAEKEFFKAMARLAAFAISNAAENRLQFNGDEINSKVLPDSINIQMLTFWERDFKTGKLSFTAAQPEASNFENEAEIDSFEKYLSLIHPEDVESVKTTIEKYLQNPMASFQAEYRLRHKNNSYGWYFAKGAIVYDEFNQPQKLAGIRFPLTDGKKSARNFDPEKNGHGLPIDDGRIGLWNLDLATSRLHFYDDYIVGRDDSVAEMPQTIEKLLESMHPEDVEAFSRLLERSKSGDKHPIDTTFRLRHRDASYRWIRLRCSTEVDFNGKPARLLGCFVDVTSQKVAEITLQLHQSQLLAMVRDSPVRMALLDRNLNYVAVSGPWESKWNPDGLNVVGKNHLDWFPDLPDHFKNGYEVALAGEFYSGRNNTWERPDGSKLVVNYSIGPWYDAQGKIGGIFIAGEDITRQRELEQEVLEIADKSQQRISEDLHDTVCQELTSLMIYGETLYEMSSRLDDEIHELIIRMNEGLKRCNFDVRRLMMGQLPAQITGDGFFHALEELTRQASGWSRTAIELIVESKPGQLDNFTASQLYLITREAVHNALKHARPTNIKIKLRAEPHLLLAVEHDVDQKNNNHKMDGKAGLGRKIMENRASLIGGVIKFRQTTKNKNILSCEISRIKPRN